jgi:hypothetical protein
MSTIERVGLDWRRRAPGQKWTAPGGVRVDDVRELLVEWEVREVLLVWELKEGGFR